MQNSPTDSDERCRQTSVMPTPVRAGSVAERVCCVMRAVAERTADECQRLLAAGIDGAAEVNVVGNKPFPETLADSLRAGLESGKPWTLCIDADVLPFAGAIEALVAEAESLDRSIAEIQPLVFDRFFGGWRPAGVHLYRSSHLRRALEVLAQVQTLIRPETALIEKLAEEGLCWRQSTVEFGVHDFEQAPADVYRKCFVHARKHADLRPALERYWRARAESEPDFVVALEGLSAGATHTGPIALDVSARYLRFESSRAEPLPTPLATVDPMHLLEREEHAIAGLEPGIAPVWDWIDSVWACETKSRATLDRFVRALLGAAPAPCLIDRTDARARTFLRVAAAWGIPVLGILADGKGSRRTFCGIPIVESSDEGADEPLVVRRNEDERCVVYARGQHVVEPQAAAIPSAGATLTPRDAIERVLHRLANAQVGRILIYGAGSLGGELARAFQKVGRVDAFVESDPTRLDVVPDIAPVLDPEQSIIAYPASEFVIASLGSSRLMVRRLLGAAVVTKRWPRRIWLMDAL